MKDGNLETNYAIQKKRRRLLQPKVRIVNKYDVLFGRSLAITRYEGNIRFLNIVQYWKEQYCKTKCRNIKNTIAIAILNDITIKGRFLRLVDDITTIVDDVKDKEHNNNVIPIDDKSAWVVADHKAALDKVKQALRQHGILSTYK